MMSPWSLTCWRMAISTAIAAIVGSMIYEYFFAYRVRLAERMSRLRRRHGDTQTSLFNSEKAQDVAITRFVGKVQARVSLSLEKAGLSISLGKLVVIGLVAGLALSALAVLISRRWWVIAPAFCLAVGLQFGYLVICRNRRQALLLSQLPKAFEVIASAVRSGRTVSSSFQLVADEFDSPIS